jgi:Skp family chaperone for outer membrane proteins
VKQTRWTIPFVAFCVALGGFISQATAQLALPQYVAIVDVAQLIKEHPEFLTKQNALQAEVKVEEDKFRSRQEQIQNKEKALQNTQIKPGTAEHQRMVDEIAGEYADFEKDAKSMQRKFALKNSTIMYETYQDIKVVIGNFARVRKIAQVTDYRMFEPDPAQPQTVAEDMDQKLVWFDPLLNITENIVDELYKSKGLTRPPKPAANTAARPAVTPQAVPANATPVIGQNPGVAAPR